MKHGLNRIFARLRVANGGLMYAAIAKNGEPINGIKAGNRVVVFVRSSSIPRIKGWTKETLVVRTDRFPEFRSSPVEYHLFKKKEKKKGRKEETRERKRSRGGEEISRRNRAKG